jgi:CRP-like cAMP-binding protein
MHLTAPRPGASPGLARGRIQFHKQPITMQVIPKTKRFKPGDIIYKIGEPTDGAYIVENGEAEIFDTTGGRQIAISRITKGEIFGESSIVLGTARTRNVRATTQLDCVFIPLEDFQAMFKSCPPFIQAVMKRLVRRLQTTALRS